MKAPRAVLAAVTALAFGCSTQVVGGTGAGGTAPAARAPAAPAAAPPGAPAPPCACGSDAVISRLVTATVDKIDLVLAVDNSAFMAEKQQLLALAIPDLISGLVNPQCLDNTTSKPVAAQPQSPLDACPAGSTRAFTPVVDMHVGLLSSSLGSFGADGCPNTPPASCSGSTPNSISNNDHGHLVTRTDPCGTTDVPTYQTEGFLAWDPAQVLMPPGEGNLGDLVNPGLIKSTHDLVIGDGQLGCGFESQNESWYRFLIDPTPYQSISLVNNQVQLSGIDSALLNQRKDFLRPDSMLVIVNVTDETDTSLKEYSSYPLFAAPELHLPHARQECTTKGPTDPCCASCGQSAPVGCAPDPQCTSSPSYTAADENTSLRAFGLISHKARYGIEFFYQPSRYVTALTSPTVTDVNGKPVPNPIFSNLDPANYKGAVRDPSLVFYAPIVGVPWQLLARQKNGVPDLINGVSAIDPTQVGGFKTSQELKLTDGAGNTYWDDIAGDPENYVAAKSPYMQESTVPRSGVDPITHIAVSPPTSPSGANPINGHERTIKTPADDIEYACIFPSSTPSTAPQPGAFCDCPFQSGTTTDNPLCEGTMQVRAKAYPGIKHLAIAKGMGDQGIAASLCAAQITDPTAADYGWASAPPSGRSSPGSRGPWAAPSALPAAAPLGRERAARSSRPATPTARPATAVTPPRAARRCRARTPATSRPPSRTRWARVAEMELLLRDQRGRRRRPDRVPEPQPSAMGNAWLVLRRRRDQPGQRSAGEQVPRSGEQRTLRFTGTAAPPVGVGRIFPRLPVAAGVARPDAPRPLPLCASRPLGGSSPSP